MTRVPLGASLSPFLQAAKLRHHLSAARNLHPNIVSILEHSFYVDDLVIGAASEAHASIASASVVLCKWSSNSAKLRNQFVKNKASYDDVANTREEMKLLGLR